MRADTLIKHDGYKAIFDNLDIVEAERFIALIKRDNFDYTEWRKTLWENKSVDELFNEAKDFWEKQK
ncbi:MAG: hypothetical protein A2015_02340 [Spirochaetes bacterium GWF1_31_7]|nr:MAG: hypothetical protein A2Y30_06190 [Spirochaetes bacterium GWE1_32_154]OHD50754.1 MAG: hypothetical protein A2015_02340 [Spirochaetes bacterium GWF1_31_7]OHD51967.1 MAG: hypothetical protein A2Y29_07205 [Spirochaetes bacterium GWE2_31_10]OHD74508.1 MAG: hypothetical protein A2355_05970 [Spirochaetes bacterium RIFOXYB1_FULL_32_8]HBD95091.1 hypothetical protein [Spirochaetia bacterium]